jgi:hypothetical protein
MAFDFTDNLSLRIFPAPEANQFHFQKTPAAFYKQLQ